MEIDVRTNGIHSMAEALVAFKKFHEHPDDVFALKDTILRSHHALETLFKDVLYQVNPALLVTEDRKVKEVIEGYAKFVKGETATVLDEINTTNLEGAIERLRSLGIIDLEEREYKLFRDSIKELCSYRNRLQHLGISANPDIIGRIIGIVIPRGIDILDAISAHPSEKLFEPIYSRVRMLGRPSMIDSLTPIYQEAKSVIELLRSNYDSLVQEAIEFFSGKEFSNQCLTLRIRDHGEVGAPPYFPELDATGFFNHTYDMGRSFAWESARIGKATPYEAKVNITQPSFKQEGAIPDYGVAKGKLELEARIFLETPNGSLVLTDAAERIGMLRGISVTIKATLEYAAEALMSDWHYDARKVLSANGQLIVSITAVPKGYKSEEMEVVGMYHAKLNHENAPFRLHCFIEPGGSLSKNRILEWDIKTAESVKFK
jgi:hypothetical protein